MTDTLTPEELAALRERVRESYAYYEKVFSMPDAIDVLLAGVPDHVREWVRAYAPHIECAWQVRELVEFWAEPDGCGNSSRLAETEREVLLTWLEEHEYRERSRAEIMRRVQTKQPLPGEIEAILDTNRMSEWGKLGWWVSPNGWLARGDAPCDVWSTDPIAVRDAAGKTAGTYVA